MIFLCNPTFFCRIVRRPKTKSTLTMELTKELRKAKTWGSKFRFIGTVILSRMVTATNTMAEKTQIRICALRSFFIMVNGYFKKGIIFLHDALYSFPRINRLHLPHTSAHYRHTSRCNNLEYSGICRATQFFQDE